MFRVISEGPINISGKTLLIPSISVGNSGTLALDLILNSLPHNKLCWIYSNEFLPIVGHQALDNDPSLAMPIELFDFSSFAVLQIRSLCSDNKLFIEKLVRWCLENSVSRIVLVSTNCDEIKINAEEPEIFTIDNGIGEYDFGMVKKDFLQYKEFFMGAGLCKNVLKQKEVPATAVMVYAKDVPADVQGAYVLAEGILKVFGITVDLKAPRSWQGIAIN